jgi:hypothetical protein
MIIRALGKKCTLFKELVFADLGNSFIFYDLFKVRNTVVLYLIISIALRKKIKLFFGKPLTEFRNSFT